MSLVVTIQNVAIETRAVIIIKLTNDARNFITRVTDKFALSNTRTRT